MISNPVLEMRAIQIEKYDHADTAHKMYENALRNTIKAMDELKPEEPVIKDPYETKLIGGMDGIPLFLHFF